MSNIIRIWHPYEKWECYKAGFWGPFPEGITKKIGEEMYRDFFLEEGLFEKMLTRVINEWKYSCEHNLTSPSLNKIAWGGQAAMALYSGVPAECRAGFNLLSKEDQEKNNKISARVLVKWYERNNYEPPKEIL